MKTILNHFCPDIMYNSKTHLTNGFQVEKVQKLIAINSDAGSQKMSITLSWVFSVF